MGTRDGRGLERGVALVKDIAKGEKEQVHALLQFLIAKI
jgi:hypothetical protein